jgi:hypothetical protein
MTIPSSVSFSGRFVLPLCQTPKFIAGTRSRGG